MTFTFKNSAGITVLTSVFPGGAGNCVMNQQAVLIDAGHFSAAGLYAVSATYSDGNRNAVIRNDSIGTLDVR